MDRMARLQDHFWGSSQGSASRSNTLVAVGATTAASLGVLAVMQLFTSADPLGRVSVFFRQLGRHEAKLTSSDSVNKGIDEYSKLHREGSAQERTEQYKTLVNAYYDLATLFYEVGWGASFHFSFQLPHENFYESIRRHEYLLAAQLQVYGPKNHILDVGCGIGGPMRHICQFLDCQVTGITINPYQVERGNELNQRHVLCRDSCRSVQGDFMHLPFDQNSFDAVYAIEATCHAPDRVACYQEIFRCLKPGAVFACYEWCMTDRYDANNPEHTRMKKDIEEGNGLPDIITTSECLQAMKEAGFEVIREVDLALRSPFVQAWMTPLQPSWNPLSQRFQFNWLGGHLTNYGVALLELLRIAPAGTSKTQRILQAGGFALRDAGQAGIFTTMYLMVGRKPAVA